MANYVLVHGSGHGAWCWQRVVPLLEAQGHHVVAVDLPGNGHDDTPLGDVTLETYAEHVCGVLDSLDDPVVLVGHSLGGLSISRAAELRPDKVAVLVYLASVLLRDGERFMAPASDEPDDVRRILESRTTWTIADDLSHVVHKPEFSPGRFYNNCAQEDVDWAMTMLAPQPVGPLVSPMRISDRNYGRVPRVYIMCSMDNAVTPERGREMYTALPCAEVITMDTDHSPFLNMPEELAQHLDGARRHARVSLPA